MIRVYLTFGEFYEHCRRSAEQEGYRVVMCLVARDADAGHVYDEIVNRWSSFHDLTGSRVAFIFAASGSTAPERLSPFAWRQSGSEYEMPVGVTLAAPERLLLHDDSSFGRGVEMAPHAPLRGEVGISHTLRIGEIKTTLGLAEKDIPCIHFWFVRSSLARIVRLTQGTGPLYSYVKCLIARWERTFALADEQLQREQEAQAAIQVENSEVGQARRHLRDVQISIRELSGGAREAAERVLDLIPQLAVDRSLRNEAFRSIRLLRKVGDSDWAAVVASQLNRLIDLSPSLRAEQSTAALRANHAERDALLDGELLQALDDCLPKQDSLLEQSADIRWGIFVAHAGTDTATAEQLYEVLSPRVATFLDSRCLLPGDDWDIEVPNAQRHALITVVLVSPATSAAYYQREEIASAIAQARRSGASHRVIPVLLREADPDELPYGLRVKHHIKVANDTELARAADAIVSVYETLRRKASSSGAL